MWFSTISRERAPSYARDVTNYLVEAYLSHCDCDRLAEVAARVRTAASEVSTTAGTAVRYVRSIFVPEDETCFHLFEGESVEAVRAASARAQLTFARVVEAMDGGGSSHNWED